MVTKKQKHQLFTRAKQLRDWHYEMGDDEEYDCSFLLKFAGIMDALSILDLSKEFYDYFDIEITQELPY